MSIKYSFQQIISVTFAILFLLTIVFVVLISFQGQRIRHVSIDPTVVTQERNQKIVLSLGQPIQSISEEQITITPTAGFSVLTNGESIVIQLKERLQYATNYSIKISGLRNVSGGISKNILSYDFTTTGSSLTYLKRNYGPKESAMYYSSEKLNDEIYLSDMNDSKDTVIFSSPKIQEYCRTKSNILIATLLEDGTNSLKIVDLLNKKTQDVKLPEQSGKVTSLHCTPSRDSFGYLFTSSESEKYKFTLFVANTSEISQSKTIKGIDGNPIKPGEWNFAPDGTSIIVNDFSAGSTLIDGMGMQKSVPLGEIYTLRNFTYDGRGIIATSLADGLFVLDIPTLKKTTITSPDMGDASATATALSNKEGWIKRVEETGSDTLLLQTPNQKKTVYKSSRDYSFITNYGTSPNDQYLFVTYVDSDTYTYDDYEERPLPKDLATNIVDLKTMKVIKKIEGLDINWK